MPLVSLKFVVFGILSFLFSFDLFAANQSLDVSDPIFFEDGVLEYKGVKRALGPKAFLVNGQLSAQEAEQSPYVFRTINEAVEKAVDGTEQDPMVLYIAPSVYWIDDPNDPAVRKGENGATPYGLEIDCEWLRFYGLSDDAENVVLACNRGQTIGAEGNFTMLRIRGDGISAENVTFGNYCNVDLLYPLKPELGRTKRAAAIVQAQLIHCDGDKVVARNTRFISRLNLCPFVGAKRVFFDRCHFESTDDALCGTGLYYRCTLEFFSSKPFYRTSGTGAVFIDCDIKSHTKGSQYFTKANGQLAVVDTRFSSESMDYLGWNDVAPASSRNYQSGVLVNGKTYTIGALHSQATVALDGLSLLNAYKFSRRGRTIYNLYNLLSGEDDWDPASMKHEVELAEIETGTSYTDLPVQLRITPREGSLETGAVPLVLRAQAFRFGNYESDDVQIEWSLPQEYAALARIESAGDGRSCSVVAISEEDVARQVIVHAKTRSGLEAACVVQVSPKQLPAPELKGEVMLTAPTEGYLSVVYELDSEYEDRSAVSWFRCLNEGGEGAIKVAVSRFDTPMRDYELSRDDVGSFIMVSIEPKHSRSETGAALRLVTKRAIRADDVSNLKKGLRTDFRNTAVGNQLQVKPGLWTFRPLVVSEQGRGLEVDLSKDAWFYGAGSQGSSGQVGLLQTGRSATLLYTPVGERSDSMTARLTVSPFKTAGQGFSVAPLYMDVLIKLDTQNMNGYGLRFQRTTKYGNAVDCYLVEYVEGVARQIGERVSTSCYRTPCQIEIRCRGNLITARASTIGDFSDPQFPELLPSVELTHKLKSFSEFGGFGIQYHGGSTTMINEIELDWE